MKAIIRATDYIFGDERKGKQWAKLVNGVNYNLQNGYAIEGDFLPKHSQIELEVGSIILSVGFVGSWKNGKLCAHIYRVQPHGAPLLMHEYDDYFNNIVEIRNVIGDLLQHKLSDAEKLAEFSTEALQAEIERRKNVQA